jgi:predicted RNA-binding Zn ribbon-like protein
MPAKFQLLAAHAALDFVNTLDNRFVAAEPSELLSNYADLLAFMEQSEMLEGRAISALRKKSDSASATQAFETELMLPVWAMAQSAAGLLTSAAMEHVRACSSPTCRWLFLDTSKNHSRRWCDMKLCGNRMKARRFQARH